MRTTRGQMDETRNDLASRLLAVANISRKE